MQAQLKTLRTESKGKRTTKISSATEELQYLMDFNVSITQATGKMMEHLTEFVFISMWNLTLARRDAYLNHLESGIKLNTVAALRTAPLRISTLFQDNVIKRAEEEIAHYETQEQASSSRGKGRYHPYKRTDKRSDKSSDKRSDKPAWKNIGKGHYKKSKGRSSNYSSRPAKGQQCYKWQLLCRQVTGRAAGREPTTDTRKDIEHSISADSCKLYCFKSLLHPGFHKRKIQVPACQVVIRIAN